MHSQSDPTNLLPISHLGRPHGHREASTAQFQLSKSSTGFGRLQADSNFNDFKGLSLHPGRPLPIPAALAQPGDLWKAQVSVGNTSSTQNEPWARHLARIETANPATEQNLGRQFRHPSEFLRFVQSLFVSAPIRP